MTAAASATMVDLDVTSWSPEELAVVAHVAAEGGVDILAVDWDATLPLPVVAGLVTLLELRAGREPEPERIVEWARALALAGAVTRV